MSAALASVRLPCQALSELCELCCNAELCSCRDCCLRPKAGPGLNSVCLQGLADAFILLGLPFDSPEAQQLNREIFETIYFAALEESTRLAAIEGVSLAAPLGLLWDCVQL